MRIGLTLQVVLAVKKKKNENLAGEIWLDRYTCPLLMSFLQKLAGSRWREHSERNHNPGRDPHMTRIPLSAADEQRRSMEQRLAMSTAEIGLSVRTTNCLEERGIFTVQDLLNSKPEILLGISNFGEKTLEEVYDALEEIGFYRTVGV